MKTRLIKHSGQMASALLTTLVIGSVLCASIVGYLALVAQQNKLGFRSQAWNLAIAYVEAGVEEGLQQLNSNSGNLATQGWTWDGQGYWIERTMTGGGYKVYIYLTNSLSNPVIITRANVSLAQLAQNRSGVFFAAQGVSADSAAVTRAVRVRCYRGGLFTKAMVAKNTINMNGNNIKTDSFDSGDPSYSTSGHYDSSKIKAMGDVASNTNIINSVNVGNANIFGHVSTGPGNGNTVAIGSQGAIGDITWQAAHKGIQPGWVSYDSNFTFPDTAFPYSTGLPVMAGTNNGVRYDHILNSGDYSATSLSGSTLVLGEARLVLPNGISQSGTDFIKLAAGAKLKLYSGGTSVKISGNSVINQDGLAANFILYCATSVTSFALNGNGQFTGVVVAPNVNVSLNGGGNNTTDFIGSLMANSVTMNGHFNFHYDEALRRMTPEGRYLITSWDEVP